MTLIRKDGALLINGGVLAASEACCCGHTDYCFTYSCMEYFGEERPLSEECYGDNLVVCQQTVTRPAGLTGALRAYITGWVDDQLAINGEPVGSPCVNGPISVDTSVCLPTDVDSFEIAAIDHFGQEAGYELTICFVPVECCTFKKICFEEVVFTYTAGGAGTPAEVDDECRYPPIPAQPAGVIAVNGRRRKNYLTNQWLDCPPNGGSPPPEQQVCVDDPEFSEYLALTEGPCCRDGVHQSPCGDALDECVANCDGAANEEECLAQCQADLEECLRQPTLRVASYWRWRVVDDCSDCGASLTDLSGDCSHPEYSAGCEEGRRGGTCFTWSGSLTGYPNTCKPEETSRCLDEANPFP
jgi:hypothetical protein